MALQTFGSSAFSLFLLLLGSEILLEKHIKGELSVLPVDQHATIGSDVRFNCSTDDPGGITWKFLYTGGNKPSILYTSGGFINGYASRFRVEKSRVGQYDLILTDAQLDDNGDYYCVDKDDEIRAKLIVQDIKKPFTVLPTNKVVVVGQDVRFNCGSAYFKNVHWTRKEVGPSGKESPIYYGRIGLLNGYKANGRHAVLVNDSTGRYDLTITFVRLADAGQYYCIDESGIGDRVMAELTVIENYPECSSSMPSDGIFRGGSCGMNRDEISLFCKVSYNGNIPPQIKWRREGDSSLNRLGYNWDRENTITESSVVSTVTMEADYDGNTYVCQAEVSDHSRAFCTQTTALEKKLYLLNVTEFRTITEQESVRCFANTTQPCTYSWMKKDDSTLESVRTVSEDQELHLEHEGRYWCKALCTVHKSTCTVYPLSVHYIKVNKADNWTTSIIIVLSCLVVLMTVTLTVVLILKKCKSSSNSETSYFRTYKLRRRAKSRMKAFATLEGKLYIIYEQCSTVYVYNSRPPFKCERTIIIPGKIAPEDIAVCKTSNSLYITDSFNQCIWITSLSENNPAKLMDIHMPFTLFVTEKGAVIRVKESESKIEINEATEKQVRSIQLSTPLKSLRHAVLTTDDRIVVSYGDRIALVDKHGNILQSYPTMDEPSFKLNESWHIFLENDRIYLSNFQNQQVIILDKYFVEVESYDLPKLKTDDQYLQSYIVGSDILCVGISSGEILAIDARAKDAEKFMNRKQARRNSSEIETLLPNSKSSSTGPSDFLETEMVDMKDRQQQGAVEDDQGEPLLD